MINPDDIIFYTKKSDWMNKTRQIKFKDFDVNTMDLIKVDYEDLKKINEMFSRANSDRVKVHYKNKPKDVVNFIKIKDFNPISMDIIYISKEDYEKEQTEFNSSIQNDELNFNIVSGEFRSRRETSMYYKGKLNEKAVDDYLDDKLDIAKKRAVERNKKYGSSFKKNITNQTKIRRKK